MNVPTRPDDPSLTLFYLHFLGGSARSWDAVVARLSPTFRCVAIDLPGFGEAASAPPDHSVRAMVDHVAARVAAAAPDRWLMAGHSMGAKVATVLARRAEDGQVGLEGLVGLVLLAGSPPAPEPMEPAKRQEMLGWFDGPTAASHAEATRFIEQNVGAPLSPKATGPAVADVLRADQVAWRAWLDGGSLEDWVERVGVLRLPTLIVAGEADVALGPAAQYQLMAPHFAAPTLVSLAGTGHLLPMERPEAVARLIAAHAARAATGLEQRYQALIDGERTSERTRAVLRARGRPDEPGRPASLPDASFALLRAVAARVLPQPEPAAFDMAARLGAQLASGSGDGWRFAALPPDAEAYRLALNTLQAAALAEHGAAFVELDGDRQDALLRRADEGRLPPGALQPDAMALWFQDLRSELVKLYVAHPTTLARMGYSGVFYGGDGEPKSGFVALGIGAREAWEPQSSPDASR